MAGGVVFGAEMAGGVVFGAEVAGDFVFNIREKTREGDWENFKGVAMDGAKYWDSAMNYYNEFDPKAAAWIRELINAGMIPDGEVDERSITDVRPSDLKGYVQHHFFCGIGGWPYALRLAGWPDNKECWTGSAPCQPFSVAGKGKGLEDERHLWPAWFELIKKCKPSAIMGEQVEAALGMGWLDIVFNDLESLEYSTCGVVLPASAVGAPHIRSRIFWAATAEIKNERMHKVRRDLFGNEILQRQDQGRWAQRILQGLRQRITPGIYREEQGTPERIPTGLVQKTTCIKNEKAKSEIKGVKHRICANKRSEVKGKEKGRPLRLGQSQRANNKTGQCGEMRTDRDAPKPCREEVVQQCFVGQDKAGIRLHLQQCASCSLLCELCFGNLGGGEIDGNCEAIIEGEKLNGSARIYAQMDNKSNTGEKNNPNPASVGAPHIRQRLWWVGYTKDGNREIPERESRKNSQFGRPSGFGRVVNLFKPGLEGYTGDDDGRDEPGRIDSKTAGSVTAPSWNGPAVWWPCRDGKLRRIPGREIESEIQLVVDGVSPGLDGCGLVCDEKIFPLTTETEGRAHLLRGYGNAIVPQVAAEFIGAVIESIDDLK